MKITTQNRPDLDVFGKSFTDMMDEFFNDAVTTRRDSFTPSIDVSETDKQFEVHVHLPGLKKSDIDVHLEDKVLTIRGERKLEDEQKKGKTFHRIESRFGSFTRSFRLPDNVKSDSANASFENGVLTITLDKDEEKVTKQISIK